jgi:RimJ/RimL family protein N-acetyltransferase
MRIDQREPAPLVLRAWEEADADAVLEIYSHPDVWPWLGASPAPCPDLDAARARIGRWSVLADGPLGIWAIATSGLRDVRPQPCGSVLLVTLPRSDGLVSDAVEVGWHLHPSAWGRGIASAAARMVLDRAREAGLSRVHAVVHPGNERSAQVCARLGMSLAGRTEEWYGVALDDYVVDL